MTSQASEPQSPRSTDEIQQDLERTREELGETVEALAAKLDVKGRSANWVRRRSTDVRARAEVLIDQRGRELAVAGGAAALLLVAAVAWQARRHG